MSEPIELSDSDFYGRTVTERLSIVGSKYARQGWALEKCAAPPETYQLFESMACHEPSRYRLSEKGLELLVLGRFVLLLCAFGEQKESLCSFVRPGDSVANISVKVIIYDPRPES